MKNQALFSSKDKSKKSKCRLLQFLFVNLRVNPLSYPDRVLLILKYLLKLLFYENCNIKF